MVPTEDQFREIYQRATSQLGRPPSPDEVITATYRGGQLADLEIAEVKHLETLSFAQPPTRHWARSVAYIAAAATLYLAAAATLILGALEATR